MFMSAKHDLGPEPRPWRPLHRELVAVAATVALLVLGCATTNPPPESLSPPVSAGPSDTAAPTGRPSSGPACAPSPGQYDPWDRIVPSSAPSAIELTPTSGVKRPKPSTAPVPLLVKGLVVDTGCRPMAGAFVWAMHRDADGNYGPESTAGALYYYQGIAQTDADGRFEMTTIRPGVPEGPSHIHVLVAVPAQPLRLSLEVWFADDPGLPAVTNQAVLASPIPRDRGTEVDVTLVFDPEATPAPPP
jgi:Dioxygenase